MTKAMQFGHGNTKFRDYDYFPITHCQVSKPATMSMLVKAIQDEQEQDVTRLLEELSGKDISTEVVVRLPRKYRQVARTAYSTPLRVSITWRTVNLFHNILNSKCLISQQDKNLALQKSIQILRNDQELEILLTLLRHGAKLRKPIQYGMMAERLLATDEDLFWRLVDGICMLGTKDSSGCDTLEAETHTSGPDVQGSDGENKSNNVAETSTDVSATLTHSDGESCNFVKGELLLGMQRRASLRALTYEPVSEETWCKAAGEVSKRIFLSGFQPDSFLNSAILEDELDMKSYSSHMTAVLPLFLQMTHKPQVASVDRLLDYIVALPSGRSPDCLPWMLSKCGYPQAVVRKAQISGGESSSCLTLQDWCRITLRRNTDGMPNMLLSVNILRKVIPNKLCRFFLFSNECPLPWESNTTYLSQTEQCRGYDYISANSYASAPGYAW